MADDNHRVNGLASGLALILDGEERKESGQENRLISYCSDFGEQSLERTLEHIFDLPYKTINPLTCQVDANVICAIIKNNYLKYHKTLLSIDSPREGVSAIVDGSGSYTVKIDESSVCGEFQLMKPPLLLESHGVFSSARANACVWKGKWMYEVTLETAGLQQLGWATISCSFEEHTGVGDADGSYAYDGNRVIKWNLNADPYGQPWVAGDVIGCCIDLEIDEISYYRNGISLGAAFKGIRKVVPGIGYYPAISLSQGERCDLNFGARPFRYPIQDFHPIQIPPSTNKLAVHLLHCFSMLTNMLRGEKSGYNSMEKLRRLKRFMPANELYNPVSHGICMELFSSLDANPDSVEYITWGPLLSFLMDVFQDDVPHDYESLDRVVDVLLTFPGSTLMFEHLLSALSYRCKTASVVLKESPYTGSYPYLALVCHLLRREDLMVVWWKMSDFEILFEGFLSQRCPNKDDLQCMIPAVWWPGSGEDIFSLSSMMLTTRTLTEAIDKIEEKHRDLCCLVMQFIPSVTPAQLPGSVFRTFLQNIILRNRGADRNIPPPGVSSNSVLVSLFTVILHFLSEGYAMRGCGWMMGSGTTGGPTIGFLHKGGQQSFPLPLILKNDPHRVEIPRLGGSYSHLANLHPVNVDPEAELVRWEEGCVDDVDPETRITHVGIRKPCCCLSLDVSFTRSSKIPFKYTSKASSSHCNSIPERSAHVAAECSAGGLNDDVADKPSTSGQSDSEFGYRPVQQMRVVAFESTSSSSTLIEEELLDVMLLLYHLGVAPNFKQASTYMSHQLHSISQLEETDRQIRERSSGEQLRRLKEARSVYREEVIDSVRLCAWYRVSLFARWKQRGMYATCIWIVQLLLVLSKNDLVFSYVPEFYLETLVDCFHVLRKSNPPFVPAGMFIKQGLTSFVTFVVTHFRDPRISSAELRDLLLQSISVLVQYKEFLGAFESNQTAIHSLPTSLLSAFDNRSWIPVTNILLRLCKGCGFGSSKHGESSSTSSVFQKLIRDACLEDEELFSAFLNRLFNTLSWAMTEFSVSIREMQEKGQMIEFQQRKCSVIFDLSSNLARVLEFCTCEIPQAFLLGSDTNLRRLVELVVFVLNHLTSVADPEFFDLTLRRPGQTPEKVNRGMILAPLVGIILNLLDASLVTDSSDQNDILGTFASMDCADTLISGFQYLLEFNWAGTFKGDVHLTKLRQLEDFSSHLISRTLVKRVAQKEETESDDNVCCICYTCEADAKFLPCTHVSCFGCINRHLINCERCFFCNATVLEVVQKTCEI
ncbi:putative transcription factor C2H2 family [Helianthus annuus]|uniref:Putative B30.2/SPRY domain-containing protein n=1 Tax=Helianthus annuus TaxID=4232 RepID=A0A251TJ21_HELAN|nr:E3 ubiquitin-protein ligase RKP [Helianthus annuus]XP_021988526.1 E3 ubiquitin-protein ligase RKP [Helianthus annuus]KAF5765376.1 putative transcription factor C2H2 family [Helianthus annuus]KAJ0451914.1 putative transcription factor C2H2 family [Helianthus annuus]KAJ0456636.1 putative transcription factor C2H2 family [Helianthus annuus]KAJ0473799.1 putative transcription factor C2H2 family [Helianthus annuus]KAJ0649374.1 putative transcription factor C2H2 family [Helianthus annuus]